MYVTDCFSYNSWCMINNKMSKDKTVPTTHDHPHMVSVSLRNITPYGWTQGQIMIVCWSCVEPPTQNSLDVWVHLLNKYEECLFGITLVLLHLESPGWCFQVFDISSCPLPYLRYRGREGTNKWHLNRDPWNAEQGSSKDCRPSNTLRKAYI